MFYRMHTARRNDFAVRSNARRRITDWPMTAAAAAVATVMAFGAVDANAMALGRVKVLSTLGEPLRAEIDIAEITTAEAESLRASPASPETFRAAGLEFDSIISSVRVAVQRRANGQPFLRLSSSRPVSDPFMDLILNVSSSSGQISRDFTMLFDPQGGRGSAPGVIPPVAQSLARADAVAASAGRARTRPVNPTPGEGNAGTGDAAAAGTPSSAASLRTPRSAASPTARSTAAPVAPAAKAPAEGASRVKVRSGDTASRIAAANLPADVSLDQMLVAMLRTNPGAFVDGNVNRIKAGAVLDMPSAAQVAEQTGTQARETLNAQSKDFNAFRRKLATAATPAAAQANGRADGGKLQSAVQESSPTTASPDKLTLSKGSVDRPASAGGSATGSVAAAAQTAAAIADSRSGNIANGATTSGNPGTTTTANGATASGASSATTTAAAGTEAANPTASNGAPVALPLTKPAGSDGMPAATGTGAPTAGSATSSPAERGGSTGGVPGATLTAGAAPAAAAEPGLVDQLLEEPVLPAAGLGLLALLAGFGIWRSRRNKRAAELNHLQADSQTGSESIFSMAGGRSVDTLHGSTGVASIAYSPSQLDAGGEVDPVAEADVYMAYGREEQALEILKEALRTSPARADVRVKLLEVHARRREVKAFEALARDTRGLVGNDSRDWRHICEIGRELDFRNSLYQAPISAAVPLENGAATASMDTADTGTSPFPASIMPTQLMASGFGGRVGAAGAVGTTPWRPSQSLDLDLDFGAIRGAAAPATQPVSLSRPVELDLDLSDFGKLEPALERASPAPHQKLPVGTAQPEDSADISAFMATKRSALPTMSTPVEASRSTAPQPSVIDFDFSSLRLELDDPVVAPSTPASVIAAPLMKPERTSAPDLGFGAPRAAAGTTSAGDDHDALSTKLALAEAFSAIGDADGARSLAHEVIGESSGTLKAKAQRFLASID